MPICEIKFEPDFYILAQAKINLFHVKPSVSNFVKGRCAPNIKISKSFIYPFPYLFGPFPRKNGDIHRMPPFCSRKITRKSTAVGVVFALILYVF